MKQTAPEKGVYHNNGLKSLIKEHSTQGFITVSVHVAKVHLAMKCL